MGVVVVRGVAVVVVALAGLLALLLALAEAMSVSSVWIAVFITVEAVLGIVKVAQRRVSLIFARRS